MGLGVNACCAGVNVNATPVFRGILHRSNHRSRNWLPECCNLNEMLLVDPGNLLSTTIQQLQLAGKDQYICTQ